MSTETGQGDAVSDSEVSLTYQFNENTAGSNLRIFLKASGATGASQMPNAYRLEIGSSSNSITLQKFQNGAVVNPPLDTFAFTSGTGINRLRLRVQGNSISAKVWAAGDGWPEPEAWSMSATDSAVTTAGVLQIAHSYSSGGAHTVFVDDVVVKDLSKTSVTTMINGPSGLLETDTDGEATYVTTNAHGDIDNNVDMAGGATWNYADEFGTPGSSNIPANHLGWLGAQQRYTEDQYGTGTSKGTTVRMGNRLYDSRLGRFLQKDPVYGGSANAYDYVAGDPINGMDLDGTRCWTGVARTEKYQSWNAKKHRWETKTREICRSLSRGAGRVVRSGAGYANGAIKCMGAVGGTVEGGLGVIEGLALGAATGIETFGGTVLVGAGLSYYSGIQAVNTAKTIPSQCGF